MKFTRLFTEDKLDVYNKLKFKTTSSEIKNPDGTIVFSAPEIEVPENYSQVAADVIAQKYFRKAGVPTYLKKVKESDVPEWLSRSEPDENKLETISEDERFGAEKSAKQVLCISNLQMICKLFFAYSLHLQTICKDRFCISCKNFKFLYMY